MDDLSRPNKLIVIGNGFDLAHGLQTSYRNFINWYMCKAFKRFCHEKSYVDCLIEIKNKYANQTSTFNRNPTSFEEVIELLNSNQYQSINYNSNFLERLLIFYKAGNWVDIEHYYFQLLKSHFSNSSNTDKKEIIKKLNREFNYMIEQLAEYMQVVNAQISNIARLKMDPSTTNIGQILDNNEVGDTAKFLNFNYTETLLAKNYAGEKDIIHIHGRVEDINSNPLIFGYGDESDPIYQKIEDTGDNLYLEHIKSFWYFMTNNYHQLISYIDSGPYSLHIVGHSCGLSDRVLLNEIFEHENCQKIEIFYHLRKDGTDNFKEITQEISRHFRPAKKKLMRRRIADKDIKNIIPQNFNG